MKKIKKTDQNKVKLIEELYELSKKEKAPIWRRIAKELEKSTKRMRTVNIYKIEKYCQKGETALIPGKILSMGELTKEIPVAAFKISDAAKKKIKNFMTIKELMKKNPKGSNVRILG